MTSIETILKTKSPPDPYHQVVLNVLYTGHWLQSEITRMLKPFDISEPQFNVLRILRGQMGKPMNLYQVQDRMLQKMSNVSRLVDRLIDKKLVTRDKNSENARRVDITITEAGMKMLAEIDQVHDEIFHRLHTKITEQETQELNRMLEIIRG